MKLATYRDGSRDGQLVLVSRALDRAAFVPDIARTLQEALDHWASAAPYLRLRAARLEADQEAGAFPFDPSMCMAPLPRAYQWADASAYLNHVRLVRRARGAELPPGLLSDPLMYQGAGDRLLGATDPISCPDEAHGIDFESELAVILTDVPMGTCAQEAAASIQLVAVVNDVSLRHLVPGELAKGFGFLQSKPSSAFSPVAVTPDELGDAWCDGRLHMRMRVRRNGVLVGDLDCGPEMSFSFPELIAHLSRTRELGAGTIVGSGTVSNADPQRGYGCIAEARMLEALGPGGVQTPFLGDGETVEIEVVDAEGASVFGAIRQVVRVPATAA